MRVKMEQYFQDNRVVRRRLRAPGTVAPLPAATRELSVRAARRSAAATYTVTATGNRAPMAGFVYSIDQTNVARTVDLPRRLDLAGQANCWVLKRDGSC